MVNLKQMRVSLKTSDFTGKYALRLDYENVNGSRISESIVFTFGIITVKFLKLNHKIFLTRRKQSCAYFILYYSSFLYYM